ncbi:uncharacterized, partial [Tachysurus ichikawai]
MVVHMHVVIQCSGEYRRTGWEGGTEHLLCGNLDVKYKSVPVRFDWKVQ